jgi:cellulose biosynthesis protein BcsQ
MNVIAVYNMKGGVGKTTTAVNLSYLAATAGQRVLLWDLDPQAASSFAFRVRPRVEGFGKRHLESGQTLAAAVRATDYDNLDLLPADFAYRKFDRLLARFGKPERVVTALLETFERQYDIVFLDCPAGFSLLTEGVFAAADAVLVPTIPTVLSLRTVLRGIKWADRSRSQSAMVAFFSMADRRKPLHRRACEWSVAHPEIFLRAHVPYAGVVERMAVKRMPLAEFAPRDAATTAFRQIWLELEERLRSHLAGAAASSGRWDGVRHAIESLIEYLEPGAERPLVNRHSEQNPLGERALQRDDAVEFIHRFDTDAEDLQQSGYFVELRERAGNVRLVVGRAENGTGPGAAASNEAQIRIDSFQAMQILSGTRSPLEALEPDCGRSGPWVFDNVRNVIEGRRLKRIESRATGRNDDPPALAAVGAAAT